jgi:nucleotidyltransferase substrate binding protein (TIGR01987 family)
MPLDLTPLEKALQSLEKALARATAEPADAELRDSCIKRFEYTFELSWKMLKRQLEQEVPNPSEVDTWAYRHLFRVGGERGLVNDVEAWFLYREKRNITSHTYDEDKARDVFSVLPRFAADAADLLRLLKARNVD